MYVCMYVCMHVCMYAMYVWWHTPALEEDRAADSVGSWANRGGEGNSTLIPHSSFRIPL